MTCEDLYGAAQFTRPLAGKCVSKVTGLGLTLQAWRFVPPKPVKKLKLQNLHISTKIVTLRYKSKDNGESCEERC